MKTAEFNYW